MQPIRLIYEYAPSSIQIPAEFFHKAIEVIIWPLDESTPIHKPETDENGWPIGFFEATAGSIPDFPEREPQGEYEERLQLE